MTAAVQNESVAEPRPIRSRRKWRRLLSLMSSVLGAALVGLLGWVLACTSLSVGTFGERTPWRFGWAVGQTPPPGNMSDERPPSRFEWLATAAGEALARLSYDLSFIVRGPVNVPEAVFIYLDEKAALEMEQSGAIWDRALHAQLLRQLTSDQARAVFFDIVFTDERPEPGVDEDFAAAMRENGRVIIAAPVEADDNKEIPGGLWMPLQQVVPPIPILREAAKGWGTILFNPLDGDYGVRRVPPGVGTKQSAAWEAAKMLGAKLEDGDAVRWLNYYGPAGCFGEVSVNNVLKKRVEPGRFKDQIVIVGGRSTLAGLGFGKDDFRNPYSLLGGKFTTGAEVHLTALLNLLNHEWLTRLDGERERWWILGFGVLLGGALPRFRPHVAVLLAAGALLVVCMLAHWLFVSRLVWFAWCVPVFVQIPVALVWAVGARYFLEERRRLALRDAFGHYLSPQMADRIADSNFDLAPGGTVVEASVLFTDLEGFTTLSEQLHNPELITQVLVKYFTKTTGHILHHEGTITSFVGDALTAVWGAPLADRDHARKAARAAWRLHEIARIEVDGHKLRTRVGLHTGRILAGNVGSAERFDYAVVGDAVNLASRLEGLNKFLGTDVLITEAVREKCGDEFLTRRLGEFRVAGRSETCLVHELLGPTLTMVRTEWCATFEKGLDAFRGGDLDAAARAMRETLAERGGSDGPAQFYLARIARLAAAPLPPGWRGVIEFDGK